MFNPSSEESFAASIEAAKNDVKISEKIILSIGEDRRRMLEELAGALLGPMLEKQVTAEAHLGNTNPKVRLAALMVLADHWRDKSRLKVICERLTFCDQDGEVSRMALTVLSECFHGTKDGRISKLLASAVYDESKHLEFRLAAYNGLFLITGLPVNSWPNMKKYLGTWKFPGDVDWAFVKSFLLD